MGVVGDLPRVALGVDHHRGVAAPEGLLGLATDRGARRACLLGGRVDLLARAEVQRQRDPAPAGRVLHATVRGELGAVPEREHHVARLEEDDVVAGLGSGLPAERLVEAARAGELARAESDRIYPLFHAAQSEAAAAFGNGDLYIEKFIERPRHIEFQILADAYGNLVSLGERECSIQRRHQKLLEESPSMQVTPHMRKSIGESLCSTLTRIGYINAGTIEFILDADGNFYFLEMNTRLQVEHPVTELVTGIDLVRHQLLIAAGQPLQLTQNQISPRGHAIEMRLYAEDPEQNFLPSTGSVTRFIKPEGPGIRIDSGIESGDEITQFYDPMIAKMIVYGEDRAAAIERMQRALEQTAVFGVKTNAPLLYSIASHPAFEEGRTYTSFLAEHALIGNNTGQQHLPGEVLVAGALSEIAGDVRLNSDGHAQPSNSAPTSPWSTLGPWRMIGEARRVIFSYQGKEYSVAIRPTENGSGEWSVQVNNQPAENITCVFGNDDLVLLRRRAEQVQTYVQHAGNETQVSLHGRMYRLEERQPPNVDTAVRESNPAHAQKVLTAPMAGTIVKVQVHEGDSVEQRQVLVILSAMKMEHTIAAPYSGKVRRVHYQEGAVVKGGAALVEME